eukprot:4601183-Pyramimonas_sp.AAC.1
MARVHSTPRITDTKRNPFIALKRKPEEYSERYACARAPTPTTHFGAVDGERDGVRARAGVPQPTCWGSPTGVATQLRADCEYAKVMRGGKSCPATSQTP